MVAETPLVKPELIYGDLKDKYVFKVVLYGHSDNTLYYDAEHTSAIGYDDLLDLAKKGLVLISAGDSFYHPSIFKEEGGFVKIIAPDSEGSAKEYKSTVKE